MYVRLKAASLFTTSLTPLSENNSACTSEKKHVIGLLKIMGMASSLVNLQAFSLLGSVKKSKTKNR